MRTTLIAFIILLVCVISSVLFVKTKELFAEEATPIPSLNICGRNLVFPYFAREKYNTARRADYSSYINTSRPGNCQVKLDKLPSNYSIVVENSLFYKLDSICLAFSYLSYRFENSRLFIKFSLGSKNDLGNLLYLLLLNPLFMEFNVDANTSSIAYVPSSFNNIYYRTQYMGNSLELMFDPINPGCDDLFKYENKTAVTSKQMMKSPMIINMKAYYLDDVPTSLQASGLILPLKYNTSGSQTLFDTNYVNFYNNKDLQSQYNFMNNISLMYANFTYPVFTLRFRLKIQKDLVTPNTTTMLLKIYMDNSYGTYDYTSDCASVKDNIGGMNNNICSIAITDAGTGEYKIVFFHGKMKNDNTFACDVLNPANAMIFFPYEDANKNIDIIYTFSPLENIVYAKWENSCQYRKITLCNPAVDTCKASKPVPNSLLSTMFTNQNRPRLANILMKYDTNFVKDTKTFELGYTNILKEYISNN